MTGPHLITGFSLGRARPSREEDPIEGEPVNCYQREGYAAYPNGTNPYSKSPFKAGEWHYGFALAAKDKGQ